MKIIPNITLQDGRDYYPGGVEVDVDDDVARDLVERGFAVLAPGAAFKSPRANAKRTTINTTQPLLDTGNTANSVPDDSDPVTGSQEPDTSQSGAQS